MATCYAPHAAFDDEAFSLRGHEPMIIMERILCEMTKAKALADCRLVFNGTEANANTGKAHRQADDGSKKATS